MIKLHMTHRSENFKEAIRMKGTVKWFDAKKGYGFITMEDGNDIFVHYSAIEMDGYKTLRENQEVEFDISEGSKGKQASNVREA